MRVAFYAPLKPPDHPVPSGDRSMARLLIHALELAGHEVELASRLRSRDADGDPARQTRLGFIGAGLAYRLLRRYRSQPPEAWPQAWLTYHLYYKAPDYIGPMVASLLGIPYLVAEASVAHKRAGGPWDIGHQATLYALEQAATVIALNPLDAECLPDPARVRFLMPFLDPAPFRAAAEGRAEARAILARRHGLDPDQPWLLAVAMMREGDKLASYRLLAEALRRLPDPDWQLVVAGGGPARGEVASAFAGAGADRVCFLGKVPPDDLPGLYAACDLMAWPAINEAYGMALLEAQAAGLPVVAGRCGGVPVIVRDGETGILTGPGDAAAFTAAVHGLLGDTAARQRMAGAAAAAVAADHGLDSAAKRLDAILREAVGS